MINDAGKASGHRGIILYDSSLLQSTIRGVGAGVSASMIRVMTIIG